VTPNEVLDEFEKQTGGSKWEVTHTPLDKVREMEAEAWEAERTGATGITLRRIWAEGGTLYDKNDNELVGLKEGENLETLVEAVSKILGRKRLGQNQN
jgi:hypothetical protein